MCELVPPKPYLVRMLGNVETLEIKYARDDLPCTTNLCLVRDFDFP